MKKKNVLVIDVERGIPFPEYFLNLFETQSIQRVFLRDITPEFSANVYDFVLYSCDCANERHLRWLLPLASRSPRCQFLILANQISIHAYKQVGSMTNVITLQLPLGDQVLKGMINQLIQETSIDENKRFPRFITDEPVRMVVMETGLLIPSRMKNYSMSGAFIEYKGIHLRVGHNLKVNLPKQENPPDKKSLQLDGRIVWVRTGEGQHSGVSNGIGVQFLSFAA